MKKSKMIAVFQLLFSCCAFADVCADRALQNEYSYSFFFLNYKKLLDIHQTEDLIYLIDQKAFLITPKRWDRVKKYLPHLTETFVPTVRFKEELIDLANVAATENKLFMVRKYKDLSVILLSHFYQPAILQPPFEKLALKDLSDEYLDQTLKTYKPVVITASDQELAVIRRLDSREPIFNLNPLSSLNENSRDIFNRLLTKREGFVITRGSLRFSLMPVRKEIENPTQKVSPVISATALLQDYATSIKTILESEVPSTFLRRGKKVGLFRRLAKENVDKTMTEISETTFSNQPDLMARLLSQNRTLFVHLPDGITLGIFPLFE